MSFKDRLKELRKESKLTQDDLGLVLGFTRAAISGYEIGRNEPSIEDLNKLANYFGVTVDYLTGRTNSRNQTIDKINSAKINQNDLVVVEHNGAKFYIKKGHENDYTPEDLEKALKIIDMMNEKK